MRAYPSVGTSKGVRLPWMLGFCLFAAIALFFLWEEHRAHILGAPPYVLLLLCPLLHQSMHHGRHGRTGRGPGDGTGHPQDGGLP